jgi:RNA polymerase sigma-70 factor (ECF subfamily)
VDGRVDRELVKRAQQGDRNAYERLARDLARPLYRIAYRIVRDSDQADDAVQQTLVAIWRELPRLRDPGRLEAWTYRLLMRFCLAESRRQRRMSAAVISITEAVPDTRDVMAGVVLHDELQRAFRTLTFEHRTVLVLRYYVGLSLSEIAEAVGVPYGTVSSRLHHATQQMRAQLVANDQVASWAGLEA